MDDDSRKAVSDILKGVEGYGEADTVTLSELKTILHDRGFGVFMLLLALPLSIPLPTVPVHTPIFALPLTLFSIQILIGHSAPWLPYFLDKKSFKRASLAAVIEKTSFFLKVMEGWTRPRAAFIFSGIGKRIIGLTCLLCALSIAIPLPLTNCIPACGICAISLGMLNRDGVLVTLGILLGFLGLSTTAVILIAGPKIVMDTVSFVTKLFADVPGFSNYSTMAISVSVLMAMYLLVLIIAFGRIHVSANLISNKTKDLVVADIALSNSLMLCLQNSIEGRTGKYVDDTTPPCLLSYGTSDVFMSQADADKHVHSDTPYNDDDDIELKDNNTHLTNVHVTSGVLHSRKYETPDAHPEEGIVSDSHRSR